MVLRVRPAIPTRVILAARVDAPQLVAEFQPLGPLESHESDADTDAVDIASPPPPDSPRRQTLFPFVAREFAANNLHMLNAEPVAPLPFLEYPLVTVKKPSLYCPTDNCESLLVFGAPIFKIWNNSVDYFL